MHKFGYQTKWSDYYRDPKVIVAGGVALILLIVLFYFIFRSTPPAITNPVTTDRKAWGESYFEGSTNIITSSEEVDLREKLKKEGKMQWINFTFGATGFKKIDGVETFRTSTMVQMEIDASSTGLPDGTNLTLSIPWADVHSSITTPGRYRYLISFQKWGEQRMTLQGKWLSGGQIVYILEVR